jgi:hypothetical protein
MDRATRQAIIVICDTLGEATIPVMDAITDLSAAMLDADAERDLPAVIHAWQELTLGEVWPLRDRIALAPAGRQVMDKEHTGLNPRQTLALTLARSQGGRVRARELHAAYPNVSSETIRCDLAGLCRKGKMVAIGDKRARVYQVR